ncbi:MAG: hypothetical protein HZA31_12565 [Opitutae bacterium]|nr:hypothetical protein [Opitutae bacterium]
MHPKFIHYTAIACLLFFSGTWGWLTVLLHLQQKDDAVFYDKVVAPYLMDNKRQSDVFDQALRDRKQGAHTPLQMVKFPSVDPLAELLRRREKCSNYDNRRQQAGLGISGALLYWTFAIQIQFAIRRRRFEAPERPAAPDAGKLIGKFIEAERILVAKDNSAPDASEVQVDGRRAVVVFRNFVFVAAFVGNPKRQQMEIPFTDILVASPFSSRGNASLILRTTQGRVTIRDNIRPFQTLVDVLTDIAEMNRAAPETYRAALAREPVIRTPWYGWLIIAIALAIVGIAASWVVHI